ncbi:MAG: alpha-glucan family phosphorylase, partial [Acidimicrobiales bacterium]
QRRGEPSDAPFNMALMGLRLAARSNAVSRLHGRNTRVMFGDLWPAVPTEEVPITSVTNGVHPDTWVAPEMDDLLTRYVLPAWDEAGPDAWARIHDAHDDEIWRAREQGRDRLVAFVRARSRASQLLRGAGEADAAWCEEMLDPRILTIGFGRRFAAYKRPALLLSQPDRLKALLLSPDRPVQLVLAGKAHPADEEGKEMIRRIVQFCGDPEIRHRVAFIENFDIAVARMLYRGCDVWLNFPRRPLEACGTSGQKAALNGALNCSILDGWWDEMYDGENGWAIVSAEGYDDLGRRDAVEADSLFDILERDIVPLFYDRHLGPVPRRWVARIKASLRSLGPQVVAARMVRDYVTTMYEPTARLADTLAANRYARARSLAAWKRRVLDAWPAVHVDALEADVGAAAVGSERHVEAVVALGTLSRDDVEVQLVHGSVGPNDEMLDPAIATMTLAASNTDGHHTYRGHFACDHTGRYGYTVRVVASHTDVLDAAELGCVVWA